MADLRSLLRSWFRPDVKMPGPPHWDRPIDKILWAHPDLLKVTCSAFRETARKDQECGLFWYGITEGTVSTVRAVVPAQINSRGHYELAEEAVDQLSEATLPRGWLNLAQVHTHPSAWVGHSAYDDRYANSRQALSLVFPHYGRKKPRWPSAVGAHEFLDGRWRRLADSRAKDRIVFDRQLPIPEFLDLRPRRA